MATDEKPIGYSMIEDEFNTLIKQTFPLGTVPEQLKQLRMAFFGGAHTVRVVMDEAAQMDDDRAMLVVGRLTEELMRYESELSTNAAQERRDRMRRES